MRITARPSILPHGPNLTGRPAWSSARPFIMTASIPPTPRASARPSLRLTWSTAPRAIEFLNEVVIENNNLLDLHSTIHTAGFYSQVSHRMAAFRPYFRYEYLNVNQRDPIFGFYGRRSGPLGGVRWNAGEFTAFKLQLEHLYRTGFPSTNLITGQVSVHVLTFCINYVF